METSRYQISYYIKDINERQNPKETYSYSEGVNSDSFKKLILNSQDIYEKSSTNDSLLDLKNKSVAMIFLDKTSKTKEKFHTDSKAVEKLIGGDYTLLQWSQFGDSQS